MPPNLEKKRISAEQLTLQTGSSCANKKTVVKVDFTKFVSFHTSTERIHGYDTYKILSIKKGSVKSCIF